MRKLIRLILNSFSVGAVQEASDGSEALNVLKTYVPDIIITNWNMEPLDGLELTKILRTSRDSPNPFIPIIMVSAYSERHRVLAARDSGINEFLVKPISAKALYLRIATIIERPRRFVRTKLYFGPDRRRKGDPQYKGPKRRNNETPEQVEARKRENLSQDQVNTLFNDPD